MFPSLSPSQLVALLGVVLPVTAPFLVALYKRLLAQLPVNQRQELQTVISSAVVAAEQVYANIPGSGQAKKQFVVSRIEAIFGRRVNAALVEVLLESAVSLLPPASKI